MNKTILFTPVGGTDPISSSNCYEGAVLHICRYYKPDEVILYMSQEVLDNQARDNRYRYCLDKLSELLGWQMDYKIIERKNLTRVHEFDYFYLDFQEVITELYMEMDDTDRLLINVSSGTPAMKSGLLVLQTLKEYPATLIQVSTPEKRMNEHIHKGYDVELLWELNEDNQPEAVCRCREISCPSLEKIKKEEIIKKHMKSYDYSAALTVAETMNEEAISPYIDLLQLAESRIQLDLAEVDKISNLYNYRFMPVRSSSDRALFEYALNMDIRLKKREYADFIRALTPIIVDLFERILKVQYHFDVDQYCHYDKKHVRKWNMLKDKQKCLPDDVIRALDQEYGRFKGGNVYSDHLRIIIGCFSRDIELTDLVNNIRTIEGKVRNDAAHELISVTDKTIRKKTEGYSAKQIMDMIRKLFSYTGIRIKKEYWNSYDDMNAFIINTMEEN